MRKGIKPFLIGSALMAFFAGAVALAAPAAGDKPECKLDPDLSELGKLFSDGNCKLQKLTKMDCKAADYKPPRDISTCERCQQVVADWKKKFKEISDSSSKKDGDLAAAAKDFAKTLGFDEGSGQTETAKATKKINTKGGQTQTERADNARLAAEEMKKCQADVRSSCRKLVPEDQTAPEELDKICAQSGQKAKDFANGKDKNGDAQKKASNGADDLMKALGPLAQAASALANAMKQPQDQQQQPQDQQQQYPQDTAQTTPTSTDPGIETSKTADSKVSDPNALNGVSFGGILPASVVASAGSGLTGMASPPLPPNKNSSTASNAPPAPGGAASESPAGGGGGGGGASGGGGGGSTGASRDPGAVADVAKELGLEIGGGGVRSWGGGGKGKGGGDDPPPLAGLDAGLGAPPGELPPEAARDPASVGAEDENDSGESIFMRVKSRYATLKGAGRI